MHTTPPDEPTHDLVLDTWRDIPAPIRNHCMLRVQPGILEHARLGIRIVILSEIRAELERLHRENREREQRAELQRRRINELEEQLDDLDDADDVLRVDLALRDAEVAGLNLELERLRAERDIARAALDAVTYERDLERGAAQKLRALLAEALEKAEFLDMADSGRCGRDVPPDDTLARIRREAGLA